jgi:hypothetical protein
MPENHGVGIVGGIDVDAAHQLHEIAGRSPVMGAGFVDGLAYEVQRHGLTFRVHDAFIS